MGDSELVEEGGTVMSVGERLREAREAAGLSLEDIATSTRIPTRHLESLEAGDFSRLPAPTYSVGFAKNFAGAVGLDRAEIGEQLRAEMGGTRPTTTMTDVFEPADPARAMPKWLIIGTIAAVLLAALLFNWLSDRSLQAPDEVAPSNTLSATPQKAPPPAAPQGQGPVVLTATDRVWLEIKDGSVLLKQGELAPGETYQLAPNAVAPTLTTAKAEALRVTVGATVVPQVGDAATKITVSLKPEDLLRPRPTATSAQPNAPAQPARAATAPARRAASVIREPTSTTTPPASDPPADASQDEPTPEQ